MSKCIWKKATAFGMACIILLSMTACGKKQETEQSSSEADEKWNLVYEEDESFYPEGIEGMVTAYQVSGDKIYIFTQEYSEAGKEPTITPEEQDNEDDEEDESYDIGYLVSNRMYCTDLNGTAVEEFAVPELESNCNVHSFRVASDGTFFYVTADEGGENAVYTLVHANQEGKEITRVNLSEVLKLKEGEFLESYVVDKENRFIITVENTIYVLDENGNCVGKRKKDGVDRLLGMAVTKDGAVICGMMVEEKGSELTSCVTQVYDVDNNQWGETYKLNSRMMGGNMLLGGVDYDFYYCDDKGVYGYDMKRAEGIKLLDYDACGFIFSDVDVMTPVAEGQMLQIVYGETGEGTARLARFVKADSEKLKAKQTIVLGVLWGMDPGVRSAMFKFNKSNDKYRVEVKDYSEEKDWETKLNADIAAGNVPDLLALNEDMIEPYAKKGILEDLTPYYEKDTTVSLSDLVPSVAQAMQMDGKYYYVSPHVYISTLVGASDIVGTGDGWTFDEFKNVVEQHEDKRVFYYNEKATLFSIFSHMCGSDFIDKKTGTCSFDSDEFKEILKFCNAHGSDNIDDSVGQESAIKDGEVLLANEEQLHLVESQQYSALFGGDVTYIGYPDKERSGSYLNFDVMVGMYADSTVKEGAWEFLSMLMSKESQIKNNQRDYLPTRQDAVEMKLKEAMATKPYIDEFGIEVEPVSYTDIYEDIQIEVKPLSRQQVDKFMELLNHTTEMEHSDYAILNIISEEAAYYFDGKKSVDETAEVIQKRVTTYVNEGR